MYAIICIDPDIDERPAFWTTRCGDTDNYSFDPADATRFASRNAAHSLLQALGLDPDEHDVVEVLSQKEEDADPIFLYFQVYQGFLPYVPPERYYAGPWTYRGTAEGEDGKCHDIILSHDGDLAYTDNI